MANPADKARRRSGIIFLIVALVLLVLGLTLLKTWLGRGVLFLFYWLTCFGFTILAMLTALLDAWIVRIRARDQQEDLFKRTIMGQQSQKPEPEDDSLD